MGLLLRVSQEDQVLAWVGMYTGALHGPGKDAAGNQHPGYPLDSRFTKLFPSTTFLLSFPLAGGDILPHRAAVGQPDVQNGAGRLSTEHGSQLGLRV